MGKKIDTEKRATVDIKVHPALREYILATNSGSDIIVAGKGSRLWGLVKMYLDVIPEDYEPTPVSGRPGYIRVSLYNTGRPCYSIASKKAVTVHTLYRDYIGETGQRVIARHLMSGFKQVFRAYMTGALNNNPELDIQSAIDEFCSDYNIELENITVEMLRKDWYRYRMRCSPDNTESSDL